MLRKIQISEKNAESIKGVIHSIEDDPNQSAKVLDCCVD